MPACIVLVCSALPAAAQRQEHVIAQVIVTAERRPVDIQDVPLSVAALTEDDLRSLALRDSVDLTAAVPGLQFGQQGMGATPFIRGVGAMSGAIGNEAPVSMYVDGVYIAAPTAAIFSLAGVRQIEVLKGPQGTLFGRNATAGVIQMETREPQANPSAELQVQLSSHSAAQGSLYATTAVGDSAAADVLLHHREQRDGWGTNLTTGAETFRHDELGVRTKLVWSPAARTRVTLGASHYDRNGEDGIGYHLVPGSLGVDGRTAYAGFYNTWSDPQDRAGYRHDVVSARIEQELQAFRLVNLLSWQSLHAFFRLDQDTTPARIVDAPISQYGRTITQELQALSRANAAWPWIVGIYYLNDLSAYDPLALAGAASLPFSSTEIRSRQDSESYALYGQTTANLTARTHLTLGARYTRDERRIEGKTSGIIDGGDTTLATARQGENWEKPTWRIALARDVTPNLMAYVSWDRGFKSGVYNLLTYGAAPVNPEVLDAYQAGVKSDWLEHRLRLNLSAFAYRYRNIQVESIVAGATVAINAAAARMRGLELDLEYMPTSFLSMRAGLALLHGRYTDFTNAPINVPNRDESGNLIGGNAVVSDDATGHRTIRSPSTALTLNVRYRMPTEIGEFAASVGYAYSSRFAWDPDNRLQQRAYGLLNASFDWLSPGEAIAVRVSGSNLTDAEICGYATATALGDLCSPRAPRILSIDLSTKF